MLLLNIPWLCVVQVLSSLPRLQHLELSRIMQLPMTFAPGMGLAAAAADMYAPHPVLGLGVPGNLSMGVPSSAFAEGVDCVGGGFNGVSSTILPAAHPAHTVTTHLEGMAGYGGNTRAAGGVHGQGGVARNLAPLSATGAMLPAPCSWGVALQGFQHLTTLCLDVSHHLEHGLLVSVLLQHQLCAFMCCPATRVWLQHQLCQCTAKHNHAYVAFVK